MFLFFLHSFPTVQYLPFGWVALLGLLMLFILMDERNIEHWLHLVDWSTLLFVTALFVLMDSLAELGLIQYLGEVMENWIVMFPSKYQLFAAIVAILWASIIFIAS